MTLIVTLVQDDIGLQISDRRITWVSAGGARRPRSEPANKAILYNNAAIVSFTGLATLEAMGTDNWLAKRLSEREEGLGHGLARIRDELTTLFQRPRYRGKPLTVCVAGFRRKDEAWIPLYSLVTNQFDGTKWHSQPRDDFQWGWYAVPTGKHLIAHAPPGWFAEGQWNALKRTHRRGFGQGNTIHWAIELIAQEMRVVANRHQEVGEDLMLATVPAPVSPEPPTSYGVVMGGNVGETPTFSYLPAVGSPVSYGPILVTGGATFGSITVTDLGAGKPTAS